MTRFTVALVPPRDVVDRLDGLRAAFNSIDLGKIPPHITLIPPVNLRTEDAIDQAVRLCRSAASELDGPLNVAVGPGASFLPRNPALFLDVPDVGGAINRLRESLKEQPWDRPDEYEFHPHLTLARQGNVEMVEAAVVALKQTHFEFEIDRLTLFEREEGAPKWSEAGEFTFAHPTVLGRGGVEITCFADFTLDPTARREVLGWQDEVDESIRSLSANRNVQWVTGWLQPDLAAVRAVELVDDVEKEHLLLANPQYETYGVAEQLRRVSLHPTLGAL